MRFSFLADDGFRNFSLMQQPSGRCGPSSGGTPGTGSSCSVHPRRAGPTCLDVAHVLLRAVLASCDTCKEAPGVSHDCERASKRACATMLLRAKEQPDRDADGGGQQEFSPVLPEAGPGDVFRWRGWCPGQRCDSFERKFDGNPNGFAQSLSLPSDRQSGWWPS